MTGAVAPRTPILRRIGIGIGALVAVAAVMASGGRPAPAVPTTEPPRAADVAGWTPGMDISYWQGEADAIAWDEAVDRGARFVYVKASEGSYGGISTRYVDQRKAAAAHGLYTGSYHFANPNPRYASGADQARLFAAYSSVWTAPFADFPIPGEKLLPPMVDLEWNPYPEDGDACYSLTPPQMVAWIHDFVDTATELFGRPPVIYTNSRWWNQCTGGSTAFADSPLSLADWSLDKEAGPGALPAGWSTWTFWQHGDAELDYTPAASILPGDQQYFDGEMAELERFANTPAPSHQSTREISTPAR